MENQDHLIDVHIRGLLNVDLLRDLLDRLNSLFLDLSTGASPSLALPRLARPSRQSRLCSVHSHTGSTATTNEQPGNTSLHHVQPLLRYHVEKVFVWIVCLSCSSGAWRLYQSRGLPTASRLWRRWCTVGINQDPPA